MKTNFNWGDDIIDSRDIITRFEELEDEYDELVNALEDAKDELMAHRMDNLDFVENEDEPLVMAVTEAQDALDEFNQSFDKDELDTLREVIEQGEDSPDWSYGETLIRGSYFTDYITDLIKDCYEMPKEMDSGKWPYNHLQMDWESAAEEAKIDYSTIEVDGETYYIRS